MSLIGRIAGLLRREPPVRLTAPPQKPIGPPGARARAITADAQDTLATFPSRQRRKRIAPLPQDRVRWLRADIENAEHRANSGDLRHAAQIADWVKADLVDGGLMAIRCSVPRLPRVWRGNEAARLWLQGEGSHTGCFNTIFPPGELEELAIDHLCLGVGIGMFVQLDGARYPHLVRLDPQFLRYLPSEDRWQYQGWNEVYDVTPGDGVWVLHANGCTDPWRRGLWAPLAYDLVSAAGATLHRDAFIWKFGNPLAVAKAPTGAANDQKASFWRAVLNWTLGSVGVTPGYEVELLQPKAEGREVFNDADARAERRAMIRIAGQIVTTTGGVGFANAEIFATIASHLVTRTGQDLCTTLNTESIPQVLEWAACCGYVPANDIDLQLEYDTTPPQARKAEADAISTAAKAYKDLEEAFAASGLKPDAIEFKARFRLPLNVPEPVAPVMQSPQPAPVPDPAPAMQDAPTRSHAAALAEEMTLHGIDRCEHGSTNRCWLCGIERVRGVIPGENGAQHSWKLAWKAIEEASDAA